MRQLLLESTIVVVGKIAVLSSAMNVLLSSLVLQDGVLLRCRDVDGPGALWSCVSESPSLASWGFCFSASVCGRVRVV